MADILAVLMVLHFTNHREIMDSMFKPEKYDRVYLSAFLYVFTLTLPHSISVNLAFGDNVLHQGQLTALTATASPSSHAVVTAKQFTTPNFTEPSFSYDVQHEYACIALTENKLAFVPACQSSLDNVKQCAEFQGTCMHYTCLCAMQTSNS